MHYGPPRTSSRVYFERFFFILKKKEKSAMNNHLFCFPSSSTFKTNTVDVNDETFITGGRNL